MSDGDDAPQPPPPPPVDITSTVTGPANTSPYEDVTAELKVRERRWFETREHKERVTKTERVELETVHIRERDDCWDRKFFRNDTVTQNETVTEQRYEDYEFTATWSDYFDWLRSHLWSDPTAPHMTELTPLPGLKFGPDGTFEFPRQKVDTLDGRPFPKPPEQPQQVGTGWAVVGGTPTDDPQREVVPGVAQHEDGPHQPCPDKAETIPASSAIVAIEVLDADTGQPVEGTLQAVGGALPGSVDAVSPPKGPPVGRTGLRNAYIVAPGTKVKVTHTPPAGYIVDHNSLGTQPPNEFSVTADDVQIYTFYDRKVPAEKAKTKTPPVVPPTDPQTTPPPDPKQDAPTGKQKRGLRGWWKGLVGLLVLILASTIAVVALSSGGGDEKHAQPPPAPSTTQAAVDTSKQQAANDYLAAAKPVNEALTAFVPKEQAWSDAIQPADAQRDAEPLLGALQQANQRLETLDARYPPASSAITAERTAIIDTARDLQNLANINQTIDVGPWRELFNAHIAALATASNALRTQLGLPATKS